MTTDIIFVSDRVSPDVDKSKIILLIDFVRNHAKLQVNKLWDSPDSKLGF